MKTIMVATDFSEASKSAALYAAQLAEAFNARLLLYNVIEPMPTPAETLVTVSAADKRGWVQDKIDALANELDADHARIIYADCDEGFPAETIAEKCVKDKVNLVVLGMKMKYKGLKKLIGSTIISLASKSQVPLLVVPESAMFKGVKTIGVAVESDVSAHSSPHLLDSVREIAERFHANIYIVRIFDNEVKDTYHVLDRPYRFMKMLRTTDPLFKAVDGSDVIESILQFAENYDVDIIAAIPHKVMWLERFFGESTTKQLVYKSHIPVLIIPEKNK